MSNELAGKIIFVTGSGRGLGRTMAEKLASLGADVAIHDLEWTGPAKYGEAKDLGEVAAEIAKHGVRTVAVTGNIGDPAAVQKMKEEIEAKLGTVNVLVNCAGGDIGASGNKPKPNDALHISFEDITVLTNNNLIGTMLVCQAFGDQHRLGRGAYGLLAGSRLFDAEGGCRALHALPRQGAL